MLHLLYIGLFCLGGWLTLLFSLLSLYCCILHLISNLCFVCLIKLIILAYKVIGMYFTNNYMYFYHNNFIY